MSVNNPNYQECYEGDPDYSHDHDRAYTRADRLVMARMPKHKTRERAAREFFVSINTSGQPAWSRNNTL